MWFGQILVLMAIVAAIGFVIILSGYLLIGDIIIWIAVGIDGMATIITVINRWRSKNEKRIRKQVKKYFLH